MLVLVVISTLSKLFGFARDIILTNVYGAGIISDAYLTTLSIPDMFLDLFANTAMMGFVPLAIEKLNKSKYDLDKFTTSALKVLLSLAVAFTALLALFPGFVIGLLAPGFEGEQQALAISFLRIMSLTVLFRSVTSIFQSYLSTAKYFFPAAFLGIMLDVSIIAAIFLSKRFDLAYLLPLGVMLGTLLQTLWLFPFALKKGFKLRKRSSVFSGDIKNLLIMSIPAMLSVGLLQISTLFNKMLASGLDGGAITMLNHAGKISFFVENIIVSSIATVLYPLLAEYHITGQKKMFSDVVGDAVDKLITFLLPAGVGLAVLAEPIIDLLFGHGEFTGENVRVTAILMMLQVIGIVGIAVQTLLTRALFSMKKIKLSVIISLSLLVVYLGLSYGLSLVWELYGIALATGLSYTVGGLTYYIILNKVCGGINAKQTGLTLLKSALSSAVMAAVVFLISKFLPLPSVISLILSVGAGIAVYFALAQVLKLKHASLKPIIRRLLRK